MIGDTTLLHFKSFREKYGNGLDKAKKLLVADDVDLSEVSDVVNIPVEKLEELKQNPDLLKDESYETIESLIKAADWYLATERIANSREYYDFHLSLMKLFDQIDEEYTGDDSLIMAIEDIVMSDPLAIRYLWDELVENKD